MKLRGTGVGSMFYGVGNTGLPNPAAAFCEVLPDTSVNVTIGAADIGQGVASVAAAIAAETGTEVLRLHAIHNITKGEYDAGEDYLSLMAKNIEVLKEVLD